MSTAGQAQVLEKADGTRVAKVAPGEFFVSTEPIQIMTVLGSCVSACIRDPLMNIGGINHFMLPVGDSDRADSWGGDDNAVNRFGNYAMESLINSILSLGGSRDRFEIKLFGGGHVLDISSDVGQKNVAFVLDYLNTEGLSVASMDVGKDYARKLLYEPDSGRARMKKLRDIYNGYVATAERKLLKGVQEEPVAGSVELF
ncbi:MAG: chemoreceptor glutamine deamidase CheD [Pseudomonadales bacterium]